MRFLNYAEFIEGVNLHVLYTVIF